MKKLNDKEIAKLSRVERYEYYDKLSQDNWLSKSLIEKEKQVIKDIKFFISRRGVSDLTIEEEIEIATKNKDKNKYFKKIIKHDQCLSFKNEKFNFFWETKSPFSQWYKCNFKATTLLIEGISDDYDAKRKDLLNDMFPFDVQNYSSAEQFMMYHKAMTFFDREIAFKIMKTNNVRKIKNLGREVKNFDEEIWKYYRSKIVYEGNKAKFSQNQDLKRILLETKGTSLVEASPNDKIWGIGLAENNPLVKKRETWQGKNLLGEILTLLRVEFMGIY